MTEPTHDDPDDSGDPGGWFDAQTPHDPERSAAQIDGILAHLATLGRPARVLDIGCGTGRVLVPLARAGHVVTGIDRDSGFLDEARATLGSATTTGVTLLAADVGDGLPDAAAGPFDVVACLGNTWMTFADVDAATDLLASCAARLAPGGVVMLDDFPFEFWDEVSSGGWQEGLSEDGGMQLVWVPGDAVFALRAGDAVNTDDWTVGSSDRRVRLWSMGALRLLARAAGLSGPDRDAVAGVLIMSRGSG